MASFDRLRLTYVVALIGNVVKLRTNGEIQLFFPKRKRTEYGFSAQKILCDFQLSHPCGEVPPIR